MARIHILALVMTIAVLVACGGSRARSQDRADSEPRTWIGPDGREYEQSRLSSEPRTCEQSWQCAACRRHSDCKAKPGGACDYACGGDSDSCQTFCVYDACQVDADCAANQLCLPRVDALVTRCIEARCRSNAECTARSGGHCRLISRINGNPVAACVYADDPCDPVTRPCERSMDHCAIDGELARCVEVDHAP